MQNIVEGAAFGLIRARFACAAFSVLCGFLLAGTAAPGESRASSHESVSREAFEDLRGRLEKLEAKQEERSSVSGLKAKDIKIGGIFTQSFSTAFTDSAFDETNFELLISARISEHVDFFTAIGWLFSVRLDENSTQDRDFIGGGTVSNQRPIILWARARAAEEFEVRAGRYIAPWGIIHREHFPNLLLSMEQPQHVQPINGELGGFRTIATFLDGLEVNGTFSSGATKFEYAAYIGNYTGPDDFIEGKDIKGALVGLGLADEAIEFGFNVQSGKKPEPDPITGMPLPGEFNTFEVFGVFLKLDFGPFLFKSEYFKNSIDKQSNNQEGFYVQPAFRFGERHVVFYRFDQFDGNTEEPLIRTDLLEGTQQIIGYNYLPVSNIRLRVEFFMNTFEEDLPGPPVEERDFELLRISSVFSF